MPSLRKRRLHAFHNSWCNFSCCKRRLPRNGKEHPFVENTTVGSAVTILIMCSLTIGVALFFNGFGG